MIGEGCNGEGQEARCCSTCRYITEDNEGIPRCGYKNRLTEIYCFLQCSDYKQRGTTDEGLTLAKIACAVLIAIGLGFSIGVIVYRVIK